MLKYFQNKGQVLNSSNMYVFSFSTIGHLMAFIACLYDSQVTQCFALESHNLGVVLSD